MGGVFLFVWGEGNRKFWLGVITWILLFSAGELTFGGGFLGGVRITPPSHPIRWENPDLHCSLRLFKFQGNLYTMFVTLDIKFCFPNIKCNLCQNTVKFQTKTSLLDKIFYKIPTFTGSYLQNWVLASMCSCGQKSWILFTVSTWRAVMHSFQNLIWAAMIFLFTATSFFACMHGRYDTIWYNLNWTLVLIFTKKILFCPES